MTLVSFNRKPTLFGPPPRIDKPEMIDDPATSSADFASTFRDLARINVYLGGLNAVLSALTPMARAAAAAKSRPAEPVRILDIGTGSGDIPRAIARAAAKGSLGTALTHSLQITATDANPMVLEVARSLTPSADYPSITLEKADALALPFADGAFDIALCSLTLHHFSPDDCARILREMNRVTTAGFIVNDLIRSRVAASLVALWARLTFADRLTQHDAPTSVLRAYVEEEYAAIARAAGLPEITVRRVPIYRAVLIHRKNG
jgi:ubiquinone/menaquinone biosynthesis C-methylase UbiE